MIETWHQAEAKAPVKAGLVAWFALDVVDRDLPRAPADLVDLIDACERAKAALAAVQADAASRFDVHQRAYADDSTPTGKVDEGIASQLGLARRESPVRAGQLLSLARRLELDLPCTRAALRSGALSEYRASLIARETSALSTEHRREVDRLVAGDPARGLAHWGDRRLVAEVRRHAYRLDPYGFTTRLRHAETQRSVTIRPAPDAMAYLTALLPVGPAVSCLAALTRAADECRAVGDPRSRGQVMADTLVERVSGLAAPDAVPVSVQLLVTDATLLADDSEPGLLIARGVGAVPVPAALARRLVAGSPAELSIRRLYTDPASGGLVAMESRSRTFAGGLAEFIALRDQTCRTPWCDAPVRQIDHVRPAAAGGPTSAANGQGLCERCNHAKQAPGWTGRPMSDAPGRHGVEITTPTGHAYRSSAPEPPRRPPLVRLRR